MHPSFILKIILNTIGCLIVWTQWPKLPAWRDIFYVLTNKTVACSPSSNWNALNNFPIDSHINNKKNWPQYFVNRRSAWFYHLIKYYPIIKRIKARVGIHNNNNKMQQHSKWMRHKLMLRYWAKFNVLNTKCKFYRKSNMKVHAMIRPMLHCVEW